MGNPDHGELRPQSRVSIKSDLSNHGSDRKHGLLRKPAPTLSCRVEYLRQLYPVLAQSFADCVDPVFWKITQRHRAVVRCERVSLDNHAVVKQDVNQG